MKPLLESAPLTKEDREIWCYWVLAWTTSADDIRKAHQRSRDADRRDAALMSALVRAKYFLLAKGCPLETIRKACRVDVERIAAGGVTG